MRIDNAFAVDAPYEAVWGLLSNLEEVAPCMPGATLVDQQPDGTYRGQFKIKVGPVAAAYEGRIGILEQDAEAGTIVLEGSGTDPNGAGTAEAIIRGRVAPEGALTRVVLETELDVGGKLAQFSGRGSLMQGVADRMIGQFAERLRERAAQSGPAGVGSAEERSSHTDATSGAGRGAPAMGAPRSGASDDGTAFDAGSMARDMLVERLTARSSILAVIALLVGLLLGRRSRRSGRRIEVHL